MLGGCLPFVPEARLRRDTPRRHFPAKEDGRRKRGSAVAVERASAVLVGREQRGDRFACGDIDPKRATPPRDRAAEMIDFQG